MADWELLAPAQFPGDVAHYTEPDGEGGIHVHSVQDVAPMIERAKRLQGDGVSGYNQARDVRHVATIPTWVRLHFLNKEGWDPWRPDRYPEKVAALLMDPDWAWLRSNNSRVAAVGGQLR